jgi:UDP-N-acetylglucosamine 2-epimerase (non-hydrolysing)
VRNLLAEGIPIDRIELTGNSVVEALMAIAPGQSERLTRRLRLGCPAQPYVLVTLHRPENVDDPQRLQSLLEIFAAVPIPVVLPLHPRTKGVVEEHGMSSLLDRLVVFPPLGYRDFLSLLADCHLAVSDSGGIQEEVSVLKVPVIVVRRTTERPEVIGTFAVLRRDAAEVAQEIHSALDKGGEIRAGLRDVPSPFGDGSASKRMYSSLHKALT